MEPVTIFLLTILTALGIYWYIEMEKKLQYWTVRKVAHKKPLPIFGNSLPQVLNGQPMYAGAADLYREFPGEQLVGSFTFTKPNLLVRDPDLIEKILVKDFQHFVDHDVYSGDRRGTILDLGLFSLTGNEWRTYRNKITPTFTTGKLKYMFDQMVPCADNLVGNIRKAQSVDYDLKEDITSFAIDISSNVIFGIELKDTELRAEYKRNATEVFHLSFWKFIVMIGGIIFPRLSAFLGISFIDGKTERFFKNIINSTFKQRLANNYKRNDYIQLLLTLKQQGFLEIKNKDVDDDYLKTTESANPEYFEITNDILTAQAFQFLTGGFDPVYNTMLLLLFELASNKEIQDKVRKSVKESVQKNGGYHYQTLKEMTYLDQCIQETHRKYPIVPTLIRVCVKDYQVNENVRIEKGTPITIPLLGLHRDPDYYPEPEKFDPQRFQPDATRRNYTYIPFGDGPRVCIGMRFALLEIKLGIAKILENFHVELSAKTQLPLEMNKSSFFFSPKCVHFNLHQL